MKLTLESYRRQLEPYRGLKGTFPFRIGTTSYIYPSEILPNVELLAGIVDEIQLILFEGNSYSNIPSAEMICELNRHAEDNNLRFIVHLPLDAYPGHDDEKIRRESVEMIRRIYDVGLKLNAKYFVLHYAYSKTITARQRWHDQLRKSTEDLVRSGMNPSSLCVENLAYPYGWVTDLISEYGLSKCVDVGHLRVHRFPLKPHLKRHIPQTKVIHLHGLKQGRDHHGLSRHDTKCIRLLLAEMERIQYKESLIFEVFRLDHLIESLKTWKDEWARWQTRSS